MLKYDNSKAAMNADYFVLGDGSGDCFNNILLANWHKQSSLANFRVMGAVHSRSAQVH